MITIELDWDLQRILFVVFSEYKKNEFMYIHDISKITFFLHFLGTFTKLWRATISFMYVCLSTWNNSAPTGQIFKKFDMRISWKYVKKIHV